MRCTQNNICWVISDGKAGIENQALGLAEALEMTIVIKRIKLRSPWRQLAPYLRWGLSYSISDEGDHLTPPWPALVIASGRQSILPALYVKRASQLTTSVIYIQHPIISPKNFDLVVVPYHDRLTGPNVISINGAPHRVTPQILVKAEEAFAHFAQFPSPRLAVMIGGANRAFRLDQSVARDIAQQLKNLQQLYKGSLLISPSRRTGEEIINVLRAELEGDHVYIWNGKGENPYFAFLAYADAILVTCESVSMISEACSTTKPVYMITLPGSDPKFAQFHQNMIATGRIQWLKDKLDFKLYPSLNETTEVAHHAKALLKMK